MPTRNAKGRFVKSKSHHRSASKSRGTTALVVRETVAVQAPRKRKSHGARHYATAKPRKRRSGGGGGGIKLTHVALAAGGLAYLTGAQSPIQAIPNAVAKLPGAKTLGNTTMAGLACLAADRFVKRNKWLRLAGIAGVVAGALQVGAKGTDFQWLGDAGYEGEVDADDDL